MSRSTRCSSKCVPAEREFNVTDVNRSEAFITDTLHRPLRDLRVSVTDRCNLRCTYCMPREVFGQDFVFLPRAELLSFEEIARLARVFLNLGVAKIRMTGGEPMMRHGIEHLIEALAKLLTREGKPRSEARRVGKECRS